ncbi:MAG TPA: flagellar assembly protein FliW [Calditrichia bacterium]|nr:flagellar assembly protein FliW [Calditrichota bacterium]HQV32302.1 flagellar assembly protein FliW [Calditrichia bacterium]
MKIVTQQFGSLDLSEKDIISFQRGIIGFEKLNRYVVIDDEEYKPFRWLLSVDDPDTRFPVLNPLLVFPEYGKELPKGLVKKIFSSNEVVDLFCLVTLKGMGGKVTINLKSPVVIDFPNKTGEQIVLASEKLPVAQPIS